MRRLRWKGSAVSLNEIIVIRLQNRCGLLLPSYFALFPDVGNKAKQTMVAVKREGPSAVVRDDDQVGLSDTKRCIRWRSTDYWPTLRSARDGVSLSRTQLGFRGLNDPRQAAIKVSRRSRPLYLDFPQKADGHHVSDSQISIIHNGEFR